MSSASTDERFRREPGRLLGSLLALVAVAVAAWVVGSAPDDETADRGPASNASQTTAASAPSVSDRAVTTGARIRGRYVGPGLGEPAELDLLIGTFGRPAVLDLASGRIDTTDGSRLRAFTVSGEWLIGRFDDRLGSIRLDELDAEPRYSDVRPSPSPIATGQDFRHEGFAWSWAVPSSAVPDQRQQLVLVDGATGDVVDVAVGPDGLSLVDLGPARIDVSGALLVSPASGGVYERTGAAYRLVSDGRVVTADADRALIETCDAVQTCISTWFDRRTWAPSDLIVADVPYDEAVLVDGTDWLWVEDRSGDIAIQALVSVTSGYRVKLPTGSGRPGERLAISRDSRWLATVAGRGSDQVLLIDLGTGENTTLSTGVELTGPVVFIASM